MKTWMNLTHFFELKKPGTKEYIIRNCIHMRFKDKLAQLNVKENKMVVNLWRWGGGLTEEGH